jgi:LmbE family N-acetylglucosaminyl deacetylase
VALSCAGVIANHRARGERVVVATFFTGDSDDALPALAQHFHEAWRLGARPFAARCAEDLDAVRILGATHRHEGMLDAVYRRKADGTALYATIRDLFGPLRPEDDAIVEELVSRMRALIGEFSPHFIHLPLGVGRHVDHTAVARAGRQAARGFADRVRIYEEFPYATGAFPRVRPDTVEAALAASEWAPLSPVIEPVDLDHRIAAARCYRSQIDPLFGSDAAMCALQREYIYKIGGPAPAERYWIPTPNGPLP